MAHLAAGYCDLLVRELRYGMSLLFIVLTLIVVNKSNRAAAHQLIVNPKR